MKERDACISAANRPTLVPGQQVGSGSFVRNLERGGAPKRFAQDGDPPEAGYRVKSEEWRWKDEKRDQMDGLSVNSYECARNLRCALLLHPTPERLHHVVVIDLEALAQALGMEMVAVYDPDPDGFTNPCHFNIMPAENAVEALLVALRTWSRSLFAPGKKLPVDTARAAREREQYERVFKVHRDIGPLVPADATGSAPESA